MEHNSYIARSRARFSGIGGILVNIPYGTALEAREGFILFKGRPVCAVTSQNAYDHFSQNDDGCGRERGTLVATIISCLERRDDGYQARWDKVWGDPLCQKYRRPEHEDFWLWNYDFFNAPVVDLYHIARLIGARAQ